MRFSLAAVAAALVWCSLPAATAQAEGARPHVGIHVRIDTHERTAIGRVGIGVVNTSRVALDHVELWRFPARLSARSPALDEHNFYWAYPRSFSGGAMEVSEVTVSGRSAPFVVEDSDPAGQGTVIRIALAAPLLPGASVAIEAVFATRIPERYGGFGCYKETCTLAGGFYPMPVALDDSGYDRSAPPARSDIDILVETAADSVVIAGGVGDEIASTGSRRMDEGNHGEGSFRGHLGDAGWATVIAGRRFLEDAIEHRGVRISFRHHGPLPLPDTPQGKAAPYLVDRRADRVLDAAREAIDLLAELGLSPSPGTRLPLVEVALRMELAQPTAGLVLVSDQLYRILPTERFLKFHSFQLVRAIFAVLVLRRLAEREPGRELGWSPDVFASLLVDLFAVHHHRRGEFAQDILRSVSFIPAIDRILYAPQVPFASAYFNTLDEPDPTRDAMERFANTRPRGKLIYQKLRDLLGDEGVLRVVKQLWEGVPIRTAALAEYLGQDDSRREMGPGALDWFFDQWLGPYPQVDYRFAVEKSERVPGGVQTTFRVWKEGPHPPVEPVELRVTERGGKQHDLKWDGQGSQTRLVVRTDRPISAVVLDPRGRLLQRLPDNDDHRLDDTRPSSLRFVYNNFGALIDFSTLSLDLSLDFTLTRLYDFKNSTRFVVYRNPAVQVGGILSYARYFGRLITPAKLSWGISTSLRVSRLEPGFGRGAEAPLPGTRITAGVGLGYDDRLFVWEPWKYLSVSGSASYSLTVLDSGSVYNQATFAVAASRLFPIVPGHGIATELAFDATFGNLHVPSQALYAGGASGLRGYAPDELPGRMLVTGRVEYRHVFVHDLNLNFLHAIYLRGIGGGAYVEAAAISGCDTYAIGHRDLFADVGYTLRLFADFFGVSQTVFNIDIATPLVRHARSCFPDAGAAPPVDPRTRSPVGVYVYFGPVW